MSVYKLKIAELWNHPEKQFRYTQQKTKQKCDMLNHYSNWQENHKEWLLMRILKPVYLCLDGMTLNGIFPTMLIVMPPGLSIICLFLWQRRVGVMAITDQSITAPPVINIHCIIHPHQLSVSLEQGDISDLRCSSNPSPACELRLACSSSLRWQRRAYLR